MQNRGCQFVSVLALLIVALLPAAAAAEARFTPGDIFVSELSDFNFPDIHGDRIWRIDPETGEATVFYEGGSAGYHGLAFNRDGTKLRVTQILTDEILEFSPDGSHIVALDADDGIFAPGLNQNLTYDRQGNFYVANWGFSNVVRFPAGGGPGTTILGPANNFFDPIGITITANGDLYAIDDEAAGDATAYRFLDAVNETIVSLLQTPGIGAPWMSDHPRLQGIRRHAVIGFKNRMLLYRVLDEVFEVLHLYHSAQDIETRLNETEGV